MIDLPALVPPLEAGHVLRGVLIDLMVRGSLVLAAASLLTFLLRRASASLRHLIWSIAVIGVLALPALSLILPSWRVSLPPATPTPASVATEITAGISSVLPFPGRIAGATRRVGAQHHPAAPQSDDVATAAADSLGRRSVARGIAAIWFAGVLIALAWLGLGHFGVWRMARRSIAPLDPSWEPLARTLAAQLGIGRTIILRESDRVGIPVTWGVRTPVVLLPSAAHTWPRDRLRLALLHELAHVRRLDALTQGLAYWCHALCWFNPLAWLAVRQMRRERERACDDYVLMHGARASGYAQDLLEIARSTEALSAAPTLALARRTELEGRLVAILDQHRRRAILSPRVGTAMATTGAMLILPLATIRLVPKPAGASRSIALPGAHTSRYSASSAPQPAAAVAPRAEPAIRVMADSAIAPTLMLRPFTAPSIAAVWSDSSALLAAIAHSTAHILSDHDRAQLLVEIAAHARPNEAILDAIVRAAEPLRDAFEHEQVLATVLQKGPAAESTLVALIDDAAALASDDAKTAILSQVAIRYPLADDAVRRAFSRAAGAIESSSERRSVLVTALARPDVSSETVVALLHAARSLRSSADRSAVLSAAALRLLPGDSVVRKAYLDVARTLGAGHEYQRAIGALP